MPHQCVIVWREVKQMWFPLFLMLALSVGMLLISRVCSALLHALSVRRFGAGTAVLVGQCTDPQLPQRVYAAFCQNRLSHLESCGGVVVLDLGLSEQMRQACRAVLGGADRVIFLQPEKICEYLVASVSEK